MLAHSFGQRDEKVTMDQVKQQCASMPLEKRARVSVTRFNVTTSTGDVATQQNANANNGLKALGTVFNKGNAPAATTVPPTLGENLASMLTNALQGVNCYRVLESLDNNKDLTGEIDAGDNKYSSKKTPKGGKQLGAQIVVTGEITEYSVKDKGVSVVGVGSKNKVVKIGFILKMINPETRDVIASNKFRVETKSGKSLSVLGIVSTKESDPAVAAVMEDGVVQAIEFMARMRDSLNITADGSFAGNSSSTGSNDTEITLSNATYASFSAFAGILNSVTGFVSMEKSFTGGIGSYTVKLGSKYEVTGVESGKINLKAK